MKLRSELAAAVEAASQGAAVLMSYYGRVRGGVKADRTLVTEADVKAEERIKSILAAKFPNYSFLGEETGFDRKDSAFSWVVDPLDGTTNFIVKNPFFAVSIAMVKDHTPLVGVVCYPWAGETFSAVDGCGAHVNGEPMKPSKRSSLEQGIFTFCHSPDKRSIVEMSRIFRRLKLVNEKVRQMGSASLELAYVGCGRVDAFLMKKARPWDVAAGALIVKEAGGRVTDFEGRPFSLLSSSILASNGRMHGALMKLLQPKRPSKGSG